MLYRIQNLWALATAVASYRTSLHVDVTDPKSSSMSTLSQIPPVAWYGPLESANCMLAVYNVLQSKSGGTVGASGSYSLQSAHVLGTYLNEIEGTC